ncbi:hypothetical protein [Mycobacterium sp. 852002-51971_SCH5477799-a]|nr:hypothetical protein [Mycobacterium sp. 852002-51971_SCH5477799-a]
MESRADVHAMISSQAHQELVAKGCSHFLGPCVVTLLTKGLAGQS